MTAALLGRSVASETRDDWLAAYADVTADQLVAATQAATTAAELDRCEYVALLVIGLPAITRDQVTGPDGTTTNVEHHLCLARGRLGAHRSDPTIGQTQALVDELEERRAIGKANGKARRGERAQRQRDQQNAAAST